MADTTVLRRFRHTLPALAALAALSASAQSTQVTVTGRAPQWQADVAGFGDVPAERTPIATVTAGTTALRDQGIDSLGEITRLDASVGDAYNAPGYWAQMRVRGYALDNRFNVRRDGLPVNAETALGLENKDRVEVLKGLSGLQAGTSSPGGLVNLVVRRPRGDSTTLLAGVADDGSLRAAADIDRRVDDTLGLRLTLSADRLRPLLHDTDGQRWLAALAGTWHLSANQTLEAEVERSHQAQRSAAAFSLLGNALPSASAIDPRINLNNQSWAGPVVFDGSTASLRYTQTLAEGWRVQAHAMTQRLRTDDRMAFPFGCSSENTYDRYCSDGSFDVYDFRSDGEHRDSDALALRLDGQARTGDWTHALGLSVLATRYRQRMGAQAFNWVGIGTIDGLAVVPASPVAADSNTNRSERSTEWQLTDRLQSGPWGLWLGLRHTALQRDSVRTDGSRATAYDQGFITPWLAATWQLSPADMVYASWGQGIESVVVPNRISYGAQAGQPLPALRSRQTEWGWKHEERDWGASLAAFDIRRPAVTDTGSAYLIDGAARHRGLEAAGDTRWGEWSLRGSALWLQAVREDAADATVNGLVPENVARRVLRTQLGWQPAALPGLLLQGWLSHEGPRYVLPDNSIESGAWTTVGLNARYAWREGGRDWIARLGVDNLFDRRAWQETPFQFGHAYLYPLAPRTWRASIQVAL
ncbi:TonB-dependent receptor [Ideonella sp. 4Y11]|uniref:TonB-dependent receptor n=1 Tax=Ideonella aquatica TaxID=2824119 RepID=A0A940YRT8_9BURK|nr:TonB-dependent receptor [Ideonella aquatica]MBQ0961717.1 TonB-dependent receptor [Ideonella aquatica]